MKNEKSRVNMRLLTKKTGLRYSALKPFCNLFNITFKEEVNDNNYMSADLAEHIMKCEFITRMYNSDYYCDKSPEYIANLFQRKVEDVLKAIKVIDSSYFIDGQFKEKTKYSLRYISSFEIDKYLGGNYDFLSYNEN